MKKDPEDAADWHRRHKEETINEKRRTARALHKKAMSLLRFKHVNAEKTARSVLSVAASAFWHAEGTDLEEKTHRELDKYGKWVRRSFGCTLTFEKGQYYQRCPVAIAHKRVGLSIEYTTGMKMCSICGGDLAECQHSKEDLYEVPGGVGPSGYCPVCISNTCVDHRPDELYRVPPMGITHNVASLRAVAIVAKPAMPDARFTSIPVDLGDLREVLGPMFIRGLPVSCDRCINSCRGVEELEFPDVHGESTIEVE